MLSHDCGLRSFRAALVGTAPFASFAHAYLHRESVTRSNAAVSGFLDPFFRSD